MKKELLRNRMKSMRPLFKPRSRKSRKVCTQLTKLKKLLPQKWLNRKSELMHQTWCSDADFEVVDEDDRSPDEWYCTKQHNDYNNRLSAERSLQLVTIQYPCASEPAFRCLGFHVQQVTSLVLLYRYLLLAQLQF